MVLEKLNISALGIHACREDGAPGFGPQLLAIVRCFSIVGRCESVPCR